MSETPVEKQSRVAQAQTVVEEVVGVMRGNVGKVLERDGRLAELDQRADALQEGSSLFQAQVGGTGLLERSTN